MGTRTTVSRLVALTLALALLAMACGSSSKKSSTKVSSATTASTAPGSSSTAAAPATPADQNGGRKTGNGVLEFGSILPQTGKLAPIGPPMIQSVALAVRDINAAGGAIGKPVKLVQKDDGGGTTDDVAKSSVDVLLNNDRVDAIIGAAGSGTTKAVEDKITSSGTIECSPSNTGSDLTTAPDKGLYFRTPPPDNLQAQALAKAISDDGKQNVTIVEQNTDYGTGFVKYLKPALVSAGVKVVANVTYDPNGTSFDSEIGKISSSKPDAVALIGYPVDGGQILKGMFQKGLTPDKVGIYVTDGMQDNALYKQIDPSKKDITKGVKGTAASAAPLSGAKFFPAEFKAFAPTVKSPIYSAQAFDCVVLIALAADKAKSDAPFEIAKYMNEISKGKTPSAQKCSTYKDCQALIVQGKDVNYEGASGALDFTAYGEPSAGEYEVYTFGTDGTYATTSRINVGK